MLFIIKNPQLTVMRITLVILFFPLLAFCQEEDQKKFIGFGIEGSLNILDEPTLSFDEYKSVVDSPDFFVHSLNSELLAVSHLFRRNGASVRFIFNGPTHKNLGAFQHSKFFLGASYNAGNNYSFNFNDVNRVRVDTLTITSSSGDVETHYRDTVYYLNTSYSAKSQNIGIYAEYLVFLGDKKEGFATGLGLASDITLMYDAQARQTLHYETGLYNGAGIPTYYEVNSNGSINSSENTEYGIPNNKKLGMAYFIRPYIPVRIETKISNHPKMANFTLDLNVKIGTEIQINPQASVNARMYYSLGFGLNYYL